MGSFLSYRCVVVDHENIELRPFTPPQAVPVGFVHQDRELSAAAKRFIDLAGHNTWEPQSADSGDATRRGGR